MARPQLVLALLLAIVVGFCLGWLARGGVFHDAADRFRDTAAALKKLYEERPGTPRQHVVATP